MKVVCRICGDKPVINNAVRIYGSGDVVAERTLLYFLCDHCFTEAMNRALDKVGSICRD